MARHQELAANGDLNLGYWRLRSIFVDLRQVEERVASLEETVVERRDLEVERGDDGLAWAEGVVCSEAE